MPQHRLDSSKLKTVLSSNKKKTAKTLAIFDFDETLFFISKSVRLAALEVMGKELSRDQVRGLPEEHRVKVYSTAFTKYDTALEPNFYAIARYIDLQRRGHDVYVISARGEDLREHTKRALDRIYAARSPKLILRADAVLGQEKTPSDRDWKVAEIQNTFTGYEKVIIFDDRTDVLDKLKQNNGFKGQIKYFLVEKNRVRDY